MSLQATVRSAFNQISTLLPETILTIIYNGQTATGIGDKAEYNESLESFGERGLSMGKIRVDASDLSNPVKGSTILINNKTAMVNDVQIDSTGAIMTIEYQFTTPLTVEGS